MSPKEQFEKYGALHIKDVVSKELAAFLANVMLRMPEYGGKREDQQVKGALAVADHEVVFDTLLERVWPKLEVILDQELIPTYSYARIYTNGNVLEKHTDRPACEISITVQLARTHHYSWPIYMGGKRFDLGEGEAVIYKGCDIEHWRNACDGPEGYMSSQVFLHFVKADGQHADHAGDKRGDIEKTKEVFQRHRTYLMENK
jgi:hypothetical protein